MIAYMRAEGGTLYHRVDCPPPLIGTRYEKLFQYPLDGHSEISNDQALLNAFYHYIKIKAYMRVEWGGGGGDTLPQGRLPPPLPSIDYVHRDEIGEIVSSILLKGIQKLQMTRLFSFPLIIT